MRACKNKRKTKRFSSKTIYFQIRIFSVLPVFNLNSSIKLINQKLHNAFKVIAENKRPSKL